MNKRERELFWARHRDGADWDKPRIYSRNEHPGCPVTVEEVFAAAVNKCEAAKAMSNVARESGVKFFGDGKRIIEAYEFFPAKADGDFVTWHERIKDNFTDYMIVFNALETSFGPAIQRVRDSVIEMAEGVGYPADHTELTLFAGSYQKTAFGVHNDPEMNFYWPLIGSKRMRFWPPSYGEKWRDKKLKERLDLDADYPHSVLLEGKTGELMAWPGKWWHIAEGNKEFNVSFTIPFCWYGEPTSKAEREILELVMYKLFELCGGRAAAQLTKRSEKENEGIEIPAYVLEAAEKAADLFSGPSFEDELIKKWMKSINCGGLDLDEVMPPSPPKVMKNDGTFRAPRPVIWARMDEQRICIVSNNKSFELPFSDGLVKVLKAFDSSNQVRLEELSGFLEEATLKKFISVLENMGAVTAVEPC